MEDVSSNGGILFEPTDEERKRYTDDWRADVRKAVEEHYLVPDVVLEKFRGGLGGPRDAFPGGAHVAGEPVVVRGGDSRG